jgi:hypothetical protein
MTMKVSSPEAAGNGSSSTSGLHPGGSRAHARQSRGSGGSGIWGRVRVGLAWALVLGLGAVGIVTAGRVRENYANPARFYVHALPPAPPTPPVSERVVLVLSDGLRDDVARSLPNMSRLASRQDAAFRRAVTGVPSVSRPGAIAVLCGVGPTQSGFPLNGTRGSVDVECLFDTVAAAGLKNAVGGVGQGFETRFRLPESQVFARMKSDEESAYTPDDDDSFELSKRALDTGASFVYLYFPDVDEESHLHGALSPQALGAASQFDSYVGEIASRLDFSRDTLIVTSDHGHRDEGGHGGYEWLARHSPLLMVGRGISGQSTADVAQVDIAPTVAALLGVGRPRHAQGMPILDSLAVSPELRQVIETTHDRALRLKLREDLAAISGKPAPEAEVSVLRSQIEEEGWRRGAVEALKRLPAAVGLLLGMAVVMWLAGAWRWEVLAGALAGAIAFAGVIYGTGWRLTISQFNISSDEGRLTASLLGASLVAVVVGWSVSVLVGRIRKSGKSAAPRASAESDEVLEPAGTGSEASGTLERVLEPAAGTGSASPSLLVAVLASLEGVAALIVAWMLFYYGFSYSWRLPDLRLGLPTFWALYAAGFSAFAGAVLGGALAVYKGVRMRVGLPSPTPTSSTNGGEEDFSEERSSEAEPPTDREIEKGANAERERV